MIETRLFAVSDFERETMIKTYRLIKEHGYTEYFFLSMQ